MLKSLGGGAEFRATEDDEPLGAPAAEAPAEVSVVVPASAVVVEPAPSDGVVETSSPVVEGSVASEEVVAETVEPVADEILEQPARADEAVGAALGGMTASIGGLGGLSPAELLAELTRAAPAAAGPVAAEVAEVVGPGGQGAPQVQGGAAVPVGAGVASGSALGQLAAMPFVAARSAISAFMDRLKAHRDAVALPETGSSPEQSFMRSHGVPEHVLAAGEPINSWKISQIKNSAVRVAGAAQALKATDAFQVFDHEVQEVAKKYSMPPEQVVAAMGESDPSWEPMLSSVKDSARAMREAHPDLVHNYQHASDDYIRHLDNVKSKVSYSTPAVQEVLSNSTQAAANECAGLPGFGKEPDSFIKSMSERIREMVEMISQLIQQLTQLLLGKRAGVVKTTENSPSP